MKFLNEIDGANRVKQDSNNRFVTDAEKATWNNKANKATTLVGYGITDGVTYDEHLSLSNLIQENYSPIGHTHSEYSLTSHTHSYVPTSRTVNGKALSANISLTASDVGAAESSHTHSNYVPTSRTINGKALSANVTLTEANIGTTYGSNSNGHYLKMENGTILMWNTMTLDYSSSHVYQASWAFPHALASGTSAIAIGNRSAANVGNTGASGSAFATDKPSTASVFMRLFDPTNVMVSGLTLTVHVFVIGRWK